MADLEKHLPYALRQFESDILVPLQIFGIDVSFTGASAAKVSTGRSSPPHHTRERKIRRSTSRGSGTESSIGVS